MNIIKAFAILAPIPEEHLISGLETCASEGKVVFGSDAWELFRQVDQMRKGSEVAVFIYPCYPDSEKPLRTEIAWRGIYTGHIPSRRGRYPGDQQLRPKSTAGEKPTWAVYWEMQQLTQLSETEFVPMASLRAIDKKALQAGRVPHGYMMINIPNIKLL